MQLDKENTFEDKDVNLFFIENEQGQGDSSLPSRFTFSFLIKKSGLAQEGTGNIMRGFHVAATPTYLATH